MNSRPMMRPNRVNRPSASGVQAGSRSPARSPVVSEKPTSGCAMASRLTTSPTAIASERSPFKNFSRAGVAENNSRTSMRVPLFSAAGLSWPLVPRSMVISNASLLPRARDWIISVAIEPIEGNASPRKPSVRISNRSSSRSFEVAWRSTASCRSSGGMPCPSSVTRMSEMPPPAVTTSISRAPASMAFSTSSLTTLAGRSITSPAAIRLMVSGDSWRMATRRRS